MEEVNYHPYLDFIEILNKIDLSYWFASRLEYLNLFPALPFHVQIVVLVTTKLQLWFLRLE